MAVQFAACSSGGAAISPTRTRGAVRPRQRPLSLSQVTEFDREVYGPLCAVLNPRRDTPGPPSWSHCFSFSHRISHLWLTVKKRAGSANMIFLLSVW